MSGRSGGGFGGNTGGARPRDNGNNVRQSDNGLNPNRQRGFGPTVRRIETPTLNDMRARQGAVVGKFMNFMQRKNTVVIDLYDRAFFAKKPNWEQLANFVYNDLCITDTLRSGLIDVQLHSVKMLLFLKFKTEEIRDEVVMKVQNVNGVMWTEFGVPVRGYSLDATVKVITVLGVSPETDAEEIKSAFQEAGVGEVVEATKGLLDPRRLPGVTNGKWKVRVKIEDPDKNLPSYIIRKEEGELWSLLFDGRRFVCWKCGSSEHIGDKCRDPEKTFEEVFGQSDEAAPVSWAAIVKGKAGLGPDLSEKRDNYAKQIRENNERKAQEKRIVEERRKAALAEQERARLEIEAEKQRAIKDAERQAESAKNRADDSEDMNISDDSALASALEVPTTKPSLLQSGENLNEMLVAGGDGSRNNGEQGYKQQESLELDEVLSDGGAQKTDNLDSTLENVFGPGATMLAIEFQGKEYEINISSSDTSDGDENIGTSTPAKDQRKKRGRRNIQFGNISEISEVRDSIEVSSDGEQPGVIKNESKKPRLGVKEESFEESLGAIAALLNQHEGVPLEDPGPGCSRDVGLDQAGGRENHGEDPPGDPEPPDETSTGVLGLPGGGHHHEEVIIGDNGLHDDVSHGDGDDDGQGSPRPSQ